MVERLGCEVPRYLQERCRVGEQFLYILQLDFREHRKHQLFLGQVLISDSMAGTFFVTLKLLR
jgi:hypothetical protein